MAPVRLLAIDDIRPSAYNPRLTDPARLALVALSLRKLGFVLPLIATADGEVISGHQRHLAAQGIGWRQVPVLTVPNLPLAKRKALNILCNRATNDMRVHDAPDSLTREMARQGVQEAAAALPDAPDLFRCLRPTRVVLRPLAAAARPSYDHHMRNVARMLRLRFGIVLPVVLADDGRLVNGLGRVQEASERGETHVDAVRVTDAEAAFAAAMLNLLSMEFSLETRYADFLRHNSFRRAKLGRCVLGTGFIRLVHRGTAGSFDVTRHAAVWRRAYGSRVVDFGAGHLHEAKLLRAIGVKVAAFEPYPIDAGGQLDLAASRALTRLFLAEVASGQPFDSVFVSSVLNSVPFRQDREAVLRVVAALCGPATVLHVNAMSIEHENWLHSAGSERQSDRRQQGLAFPVGYEPGTLMASLGEEPKVQKYHTGQELHALLRTAFKVANVERAGPMLFGRARDPLPVDPAALADAIRFEFDLPYPDGQRLGRHAEALAAFAARQAASSSSPKRSA